MMQERIRCEAYRTTLICVDSYERGVLTGRFYSGQEEDAVEFQSLSQLLVRMEQRLDQMNFPQSFTAMRSFVPLAGPKFGDSTEANLRTGALATFAVKVLFRQHTSWQGVLRWREQKAEHSFRSVLELVMLMDSALKSREGCEAV